MFNNCRMPKKPSDYEAIYDPSKHSHIIAIRKNKFYVIDTIHDGQQLSTSELELQFQRVIESAGEEKGPAIGALTAENRDIWTDVSFSDYQAKKGEIAGSHLCLQSDIIARSVCDDDSGVGKRVWVHKMKKMTNTHIVLSPPFPRAVNSYWLPTPTTRTL
jgi:carnitine O-acetyltransferase